MTDQLLVFDVVEVYVVQVEVLAYHSLVRQEEHRISASHAADGAVEIRSRRHTKSTSHGPAHAVFAQLTSKQTRRQREKGEKFPWASRRLEARHRSKNKSAIGLCLTAKLIV